MIEARPSFSKVIFLIAIALLSGLAMSLGRNFDRRPMPMEPAVFRNLPNDSQLKTLKEIGTEYSPEEALALLKAAYPEEPANIHEVSHKVGEAAYIRYGYDGFKVCDSFLRFGCYHGVILQAVKENGYTDSVMRDLANGCVNIGGNRATQNSCIHGIGHGVMWVYSYDIGKSLERCDAMFDAEIDRFFCYDGIFMENVVRRGDDAASKGEALDPENPLMPCAALAEKYQPACVREHVHYVRRFIYRMDIPKTVDYCLAFGDENARKECFGGVGNGFNQDYGEDPDNVAEKCGEIPSTYRQNCIGVAAAQYAFGRQLESAIKLCDSLSVEAERSGCLNSARQAYGYLE